MQQQFLSVSAACDIITRKITRTINPARSAVYIKKLYTAAHTARQLKKYASPMV